MYPAHWAFRVRGYWRSSQRRGEATPVMLVFLLIHMNTYAATSGMARSMRLAPCRALWLPPLASSSAMHCLWLVGSASAPPRCLAYTSCLQVRAPTLVICTAEHVHASMRGPSRPRDPSHASALMYRAASALACAMAASAASFSPLTLVLSSVSSLCKPTSMSGWFSERLPSISMYSLPS